MREVKSSLVPTPQAIGTWLRHLGKDNQGIKALRKANKMLLKATLNNCKNITLDIDASEVIANKADAQWTYKGNKGYMPILSTRISLRDCHIFALILNSMSFSKQ
jgi:hypothetical protein